MWWAELSRFPLAVRRSGRLALRRRPACRGNLGRLTGGALPAGAAGCERGAGGLGGRERGQTDHQRRGDDGYPAPVVRTSGLGRGFGGVLGHDGLLEQAGRERRTAAPGGLGKTVPSEAWPAHLARARTSA